MLGRLLLTAVLAAGVASAQRGGGGGGRGGRGGGGEEGGPMPRMTRMSKPELLREKLGLNKEQAEAAQKALVDASQAAGPIRAQIENARVQIAGALIEGKGDEEVQKALAAYAAAYAQMTNLEAKAFGEIYATLKPKQQAKAEQSFEYMSGIFMGQGGGGRGQGRQGQGRQGR